MPELPEMENYKLLLKSKIENQQITDVHINREKSINVPVDRFIKIVKDNKIVDINRKAKHLLFYLQDGQVLLLHLMLGGWMFYGSEEEKPDRTVQVQLTFGQSSLYFIGLRLGYLHLYEEKEVEAELQDLGPDPLDINFSFDQFQEITSNKRGRIKTTLLDQHVLAGIGNCYSDEICWHAQLNPSKKMNELNIDSSKRLYDSIRYVLTQGLQHGGYMEHGLFIGDTKTGGVVKVLKVYDREGQSCSRCGHTIIKESISSRKTFYCTNCQKE